MKANANTVTCSFTMDRDLYNTFKSIIVARGENVKGSVIEFMNDVVKYQVPNAQTILAIREVEAIKRGEIEAKRYKTFDEALEDIDW